MKQFLPDLRTRRGQYTVTFLIFLVLPWLMYAWVAITGVTFEGGSRVQTGPSRIATSEDVWLTLAIALFMNGVALVTFLILWLTGGVPGKDE